MQRLWKKPAVKRRMRLSHTKACVVESGWFTLWLSMSRRTPLWIGVPGHPFFRNFSTFPRTWAAQGCDMLTFEGSLSSVSVATQFQS